MGDDEQEEDEDEPRADEENAEPDEDEDDEAEDGDEAPADSAVAESLASRLGGEVESTANDEAVVKKDEPKDEAAENDKELAPVAADEEQNIKEAEEAWKQDALVENDNDDDNDKDDGQNIVQADTVKADDLVSEKAVEKEKEMTVANEDPKDKCPPASPLKETAADEEKDGDGRPESPLLE